jgi:molybdenum cofactor cytidylyltransferase
VREDTLARLLEALTENMTDDPARIVVPEYRGTPGHPVGFGAAHLPALAALTGDRGARAVLQASATAPVRIDVDDPGVLRDVDRPEDLDAPA